MPPINRSTVIEAPAAKVWERIRAFNSLPEWHPSIKDSRIENDAPDKAGCVRDFHLQNGARIREELVERSDSDMFYTYKILESPMPITNYVSTIRLTSITDGDHTFAQWTANFECAPDEAEGLVVGIGNDVYQAGFDALKQHAKK
eukprot:m.19773 g.19773  ORF g.19773 m.19773 type:complete len:145 (+) comp12606_c0_seq1:338-772(+)